MFRRLDRRSKRPIFVWTFGVVTCKEECGEGQGFISFGLESTIVKKARERGSQQEALTVVHKVLGEDVI